jgi:hypothetical protein
LAAVRQRAKDRIMGVIMAEPKMTAPFTNRRLQNRFNLPPETDATLQFNYPTPNGPRLATRMRDISLSGLSMMLPQELADVQAGDIVSGIEAKVARKSFRGDLLVMHVTSVGATGSVCGGLFYPEADEDLITIRLVVRALEAESKANS